MIASISDIHRKRILFIKRIYDIIRNLHRIVQVYFIAQQSIREISIYNHAIFPNTYIINICSTCISKQETNLASIQLCRSLKLIFITYFIFCQCTVKGLSSYCSLYSLISICVGIKTKNIFLSARNGNVLLEYCYLIKTIYRIWHYHFQLPYTVIRNRYTCTLTLSNIPVPICKTQSTWLIAFIKLSIVNIIAVRQYTLFLFFGITFF